MAQDRPTATELLEAVREFLEAEVLPTVDGRLAFHTRVAANALGIVGRELALGTEHDAEEHARLVGLLGRDAPLAELNRDLAARLRAGELDDRRTEVVAHLRSTVQAKLEIANPSYTL